MRKNKNALYTVYFCAAAALCLFLSWLFLCYFSLSFFFTVPAAVGLLLLFHKVIQLRNRRLFICSGVFSFLLSASFVVGGKIDTTKKIFEPVYPADFLYLAVLTAIFFQIFCCIMNFVMQHPISLKATNRFRPRTVWVACTVFLFLCWLPGLLIYYPGNLSIDSLSCILIALGKASMVNHQPVAYILLVRLFLNGAQALGQSINFGIAAMMTVQIAAMATMSGYFLCWLTGKGFSLWVRIPVLAWFALNPLIAIYAATMWKDILFGGLLLIYVLNLYDIVASKGSRLREPLFLIWFLLLNLLICFLRNNGYYITFLTLGVLLVLYRHLWKRLLPAFLALLVAVPIIQGPVYTACGVGKSPFSESVGIPLQQIGRAVADNGTMTEEERTFLNRVMPLDAMKKAYDPFTADRLKFNAKFDRDYLETHKSEFFKTWVGMLAPNLASYVKAYLMETLGYWHIGTTNWAACFGVVSGYGEDKLGIQQINLPAFADNRTIVQQTVGRFQSEVPLLSLLANIGFLFWAAVFAVFMMFLRKDKKKLLTLFPLIILWLTLMVATPTFCEFRYMYAFAMAFPAVVLLAFPHQPPKQNKVTLPVDTPAAE